MFNTSELEQAILSLSKEDNIQLNELPEMDLYMDQLLKFLNTRIKPTQTESSTAFTKTMINNYARKDSILMQPKDKKYNHYHILSLILIYHFKNILSMEDIKVLFSYMFNDIDDPGDDIIHPETVYTAFCKFKTACSDQLLASLSSQLEVVSPELEKTSEHNRKQGTNLLLVLMLVTQADLCKKLATKIIADNFVQEEQQKDLTTSNNGD